MKKPKELDTTHAHYTVGKLLGEGGAGVAYSASDDDGTVKAVKILRPSGITKDRLKRFRNELDFCRRQEHARIVPVLDDGFCMQGAIKCPFYVMPYYDATLADLIEEGIEPDLALRLFSDMLDGVEAAHLLDIWHRDLKPKNILCSSSGERLVVADWGIARFAEDQLVELVRTGSSDRMANFEYAAPEQRRGGSSVDARADLYALGLMLNEMYTGEVPLGLGFRKIGDVCPSHGFLDEICDRLIQKYPDDRYQSVAELKGALAAHRVAFVARQRLDATRQKVVPRSTPEGTQEITVLEVDDFAEGRGVEGSSLTIRLSERPSDEWKRWFESPRGIGGYQYTNQMRPELCKFAPQDFSGGIGTAVIPATEDTAGKHLAWFREYVRIANQECRERAAEQARAHEEEAIEKLQRERVVEERRVRVLEGLRDSED